MVESSNIVLAIVFMLFFGVIVTLLEFATKSMVVSKISSALTYAIFFTFIFYLFIKYQEVRYPPFRTLFESLMFLGACTTFVYVAISIFYKIRSLKIAILLFNLAIIFYAFTKKDIDTTNLPPALQSFWFIPHVVVYFFGYSALFVGAALSVIYLLNPEKKVVLQKGRGHKASIPVQNLMHSVTKTGYIFITSGLVIGGLWAKQAWGDYWSFDPKENWSLVTFLIYTAYFHLRYQKNWSPKKSAVVLIIGFVAVMFTYLGITLLPTAKTSIHTYNFQ